MVTDFHSASDASDSSPDILDSTPDASCSPSTSSIPIDMLMTRKEVAQTLRITTHCLNSHKEKWKEVLPRIEMADSSIIRYRRSDVMRLIEQGYKPFSSDEQTEEDHDRV
jgi:hypothetical protein